MYDMVIDGKEIVSSYPRQFSGGLLDHSYPGLLNKMKERVLVVKAFETTIAPGSASRLSEERVADQPASCTAYFPQPHYPRAMFPSIKSAGTYSL